MIDINLIRKESERIKENIKKKFQLEKLALVDKILKNDSAWRNLKSESDNLRAQRNKISIEISEAKKGGDETVKKYEDVVMSLELVKIGEVQRNQRFLVPRKNKNRKLKFPYLNQRLRFLEGCENGSKKCFGSYGCWWRNDGKDGGAYN